MKVNDVRSLVGGGEILREADDLDTKCFVHDQPHSHDML